MIRWLDDHGEPFLKRKVAIGKNVEEARKLDRMHTEFKDKIAENTYMNATLLQHMSEDLIRAGEINVQRAVEYTNRLKQRIDQFSRKVDSRTKLLYLAKNFYTHYCEIMDYYSNTLVARNDRLILVNPEPATCEDNKTVWLHENEKWREVGSFWRRPPPSPPLGLQPHLQRGQAAVGQSGRPAGGRERQQPGGSGLCERHDPQTEWVPPPPLHPLSRPVPRGRGGALEEPVQDPRHRLRAVRLPQGQRQHPRGDGGEQEGTQ